MTDSADESNAKADHSIIQVEENEDELIASWIERKLPKESTGKPVHTCIFRAPTEHVRDNENAFFPQVVSIGPYHRGREKLQGMEQTKLWYLQRLLDRKPTPDTSVGKFVKEIRSREEFLRNCYDERLHHLSSREFVEMMVVDGCFILKLLRESVSPFPGWVSTFKNDLLLLENQLPWQVLDCLCNLTKTSEEVCLYILILELSEKLPCPIETDGYLLQAETTGTLEFRHLLDAVRTWTLEFSCSVDAGSEPPFGSSGSVTWGYKRDWIPIPSVTRLEEIGVKFQSAFNEKNLLDITFNLENRVMEIPSLIIRSNSESLFRNLIAYEQCQLVDNLDKCPILSYAMLLNQLIKSAKDLLSLMQKGIIHTDLGVEDTVCFFNRLRYDTEDKMLFYTDLARQVNRYYYSRWLRHCLASIKEDYLYNPSSIWSVSNAVIFFLILTIVQTVYSVLAYYK